jgi:hypothetical protein
VRANTRGGGKKERTPRKPERILRIYDEYLAQLLDGCFLWRQKNPKDEISTFLERMPPFSFAGVAERPKVTNLFFAYLDASVLADCLRKKLPGDHPSRIRKIAKNKKVRAEYEEKKLACIQEAITETFDPAPKFSQWRMNRWVRLSVESIALEVGASQNNVDLSSLKRHGRTEWQKVSKPRLGLGTLLNVMKGNRPAFQEFRDNLLRLQKRILPSYWSLYLPTKNPPLS